MIDFHCHILPELDDGARSMDESLEMAKRLFSMGFSAILATPHLVEDCFVWQEEAVSHHVALLNEACRQAGIQLTVYPGAEVTISPWVLELLAGGQLTTLNKSKYLLFELPLAQPLTEFMEDIFFRLRTHGYRLVLAHPERNLIFQEEPEKLLDLRKYELHYQLNLSSLTGHFGDVSRKLAINMLKQGLVTFVGSDAHHPGKGRMGDIPLALDLLRRCVGEAGMYSLLKKNPLNVLNDEQINLEPIAFSNGRAENRRDKHSLIRNLFKKRRR